jgi:hypothetical protein
MIAKLFLAYTANFLHHKKGFRDHVRLAIHGHECDGRPDHTFNAWARIHRLRVLIDHVLTRLDLVLTRCQRAPAFVGAATTQKGEQ